MAGPKTRTRSLEAAAEGGCNVRRIDSKLRDRWRMVESVVISKDRRAILASHARTRSYSKVSGITRSKSKMVA